jgi:segregation and condensation protein B
VASQDRLTASGEQKQAPEQSAGPEEPETCEHDAHVSPIGIIEAALFVGHPSNQPLSDVRLASLMRDVTPEEVNAMIQELNASYRRHHQALRITRVEGGYCMTVAPEVDGIRHAFLGKVREARLNQSAVEVLALVAYQPGITAQKVQDQRGHDSAAALNQLVRRGLVEVRRSPESGQKSVAQYHPTERFLALFGLETLSDLPHVEDT